MSELEISVNGIKKNFPKYTTYYEISKSFSMSNKIIGALVKNKPVSLNDRAEHGGIVQFLDLTSAYGNRIYTAGLKMVFEYAVKKSFPNVKVEYSYSLPKGIIAELVYDKLLTNDDISLIRKSMATIVSNDMIIEKLNVKNSDGITYYEELGNPVKADNIKNIVDSTVVLYRLDDLINYYYSEMPHSTGAIDKYEIRYLGKNLVAINYPGANDEGKLPEYVNYKGVIASYEKGKQWLETMKVPFINDVNRAITTGKISNFIKSCELNFNLQINEAAKNIALNKNIKCVMIAGPSSSGKTTVTKTGHQFGVKPEPVVKIELKNYTIQNSVIKFKYQINRIGS